MGESLEFFQVPGPLYGEKSILWRLESRFALLFSIKRIQRIHKIEVLVDNQ